MPVQRDKLREGPGKGRAGVGAEGQPADRHQQGGIRCFRRLPAPQRRQKLLRQRVAPGCCLQPVKSQIRQTLQRPGPQGIVGGKAPQQILRLGVMPLRGKRARQIKADRAVLRRKLRGLPQKL